MATLTRPRPVVETIDSNRLESGVPTPFPIHFLREARAHDRQVTNNVLANESSGDSSAEQDTHVSVEGQLGNEAEVDYESQEAGENSEELLSSLVHVENSCLLSLNNLLSGARELGSEWLPIIPPRRHSMPSGAVPENSSESPSQALQTLLDNLRGDEDQAMSQASTSNTDQAFLIDELRRRVDVLTVKLSPSDARLAQALVSLLAHANRLSSIDPKLIGARPDSFRLPNVAGPSNRLHGDVYDELSRQVVNLQARITDQETFAIKRAETPARKIEIALLWSKIDQDLESVFSLCRQRSEPFPMPYSPEQLPPDYNDHFGDDATLPPEYELDSATYSEKPPEQMLQSPIASSHNEKMRMDLEAVTMAIDRLYMVAPQLHNQRVELKKGKLEELERARLAGPSIQEGKGKEKDVKELNKIMDLIGKASSRRIDNQSVVLEGDMQSRIEKARRRDSAKREAFVEKLISHSESRRIHSQDAVFTPRMRDPDSLLSLPEFIQEQVPLELQEDLDPEALLTLPEFVKEPPPRNHYLQRKTPSPPSTIRSAKSERRNRSLSAPPLAWLLSHRGRSTPQSQAQTSEESPVIPQKCLTVRYVAEHHANLHHILVFLGVDEGLAPGFDLEANVGPSFPGSKTGDKLVLNCGSNRSLPLSLPVSVPVGRKEVQVARGHYEIKILTEGDVLGSEQRNESFSTPLDASEIQNMHPTSFICSSCSLVLAQPTGNMTYHDLPSEHWAELLEAWMCHRDQKINDQVSQHSIGFWPQPGQAFVGGSYVLFNESAIIQTNIRLVDTQKDDNEWTRVQCICGAVVGKYQSHPLRDGPSTSVYRLAKYAFRPVSPTAEPCRLPFSAFLVLDMMEYVQAHATYRFIISDEEEGRPRLLLWLFKPKIRLSYATTAQYALPPSGSVQAAKVLFRLLGPDTTSNDLEKLLDKHPGFPQAERLLYPMDVCHRLASLLKESNTSYPMGMRVMTGLLVGWLRRS